MEEICEDGMASGRMHDLNRYFYQIGKMKSAFTNKMNYGTAKLR
jgi:hypothetical protein